MLGALVHPPHYACGKHTQGCLRGVVEALENMEGGPEEIRQDCQRPAGLDVLFGELRDGGGMEGLQAVSADLQNAL